MTLRERYADLITPLEMFGKVYPAQIAAPLTVDKLTAYADRMLTSQLPMVKGCGQEMKTNIAWANYGLDNEIIRY